VTKYSYLPPGQKVPLWYNVLPTWSVGGYAAMLVIVLVVSIGLFLGALIVFGRLEGNFAEEL
jgi:hypothetical protein